jgi:transposase
MPRGRGQPTKLTPERQQKFIDALSAGNYLEVAAHYAGISHTTFYRWMEQGKEQSSGQYHEFCAAVKKAQIDSEVARVARITQAASQGTWTADAWYLERRYPERWGKQVHEITGRDGGPMTHEIHVVYDEVATPDEPDDSSS